MLHVLYGTDDFRVSEALRALKASLDPDGMLATNTSVLAGRGLTPHVLIQHASAMPFPLESMRAKPHCVVFNATVEFPVAS